MTRFIGQMNHRIDIRRQDTGEIKTNGYGRDNGMITLGNMEATRTSWLLGATLKVNFKYEDEVFGQRGRCT